jgi:predicted PurR-regulated permease PerM
MVGPRWSAPVSPQTEKPAAVAPYAGDRFYPRLFAVAALGLLGWLLYRIFRPFFGPIVWSALLAFLLQPLHDRLTRRLHGRTGLAAGLLTMAATIGLVLPATFLFKALAGQASQLVAAASESSAGPRIGQPSDLLRLAPVATALDWLRVHFSLTTADVEMRGKELAGRLLETFAARGGAFVLGAFGQIASLALTLFLLFFFLRDGVAVAARLYRIVPLPEDRKKGLERQLAAVTKAVVLGTLVTAIVQGALVGLGFAAVRFPSPVLFGALAAALSLLPVGGTALVWLPGAIVLASQGRWPWAVGMALYGVLIVSVMTNDVLKPRLISGHADIGTLPVFLGVLGGLASFGLLGLILGPVLVAFAGALLKWAEEDARAPIQPRR